MPHITVTGEDTKKGLKDFANTKFKITDRGITSHTKGKTGKLEGMICAHVDRGKNIKDVAASIKKTNFKVPRWGLPAKFSLPIGHPKGWFFIWLFCYFVLTYICNRGCPPALFTFKLRKMANKYGKIMGKAKLNKAANYYVHSSCGGSIMYDGIVTSKKAVDLAIAGTQSGVAIVVNHLETKYVSGCCLKCGKDGLFELSKKNIVSSRIKKIAA